jgi:hypothetical protein
MKPSKKKTGKGSVGSGRPNPTARGRENHDARKTIFAGFFIGLLFTVMLIGANWAFERTHWGAEILSMSYNLLQRQLASGAAEEDLPVIIVDINDLKTDKDSQATPRKALEALIDQIAKQHPKAIGIDLDFSPDEHGYITQDDPDFFDYCLALKSKTPIFLGIWRSQANPPSEWLGVEGYKDIAASIMIPKEDTREMVKRTVSEDGRQTGRTMAGALVNSIPEAEDDILVCLNWAVESVSKTRLSPDLSVEQFLVDYSPLKALEKERLHTKSPEVISDQGRLLKNKFVLVGDATIGAQGDNFVIPGHGGTTPGVYFHACAVYTLAKAPLYQLTLRGRLTIDLLLSAVVIGSVTVIRLRYRTAAQTVANHRIQRAFTLVMALAAFVGGYVFVARTRIFWDDFMLVIAALLLHPYVEQTAIKFVKWCRILVPAAWRKLVFDAQKEERR